MRAAKLGLDISYVDNLLKDPSISPSDGYLFWYYKSRAGFVFQWVLVDVVLLLAIAAFLITKRWTKLAKWGATGLFVALIRSSVVLGINAYIFAKKPEALRVDYMILPGILLLACLALSMRATGGSKSKDASESPDRPSH